MSPRESEEMDVQGVAEILLSSATEDEVGLYEAIWELNGKFPAEPLGRKYDLASRALIDLHRRGWIRLEKVTKTRGERRLEEIAARDVEEMLKNPVSWYPEYDGSSIVFVCTDAGMASYLGKSVS